MGQEARYANQRGRPFAVAVVVVGVGVALAAGLLVGGWAFGGPGSPSPSGSSAEAQFARDMQRHHEQAVTMSVMVREATDDPEIRNLALDILLTQQHQIGQMHAWLQLWGLSQATPDSAPPGSEASQGGHQMGDQGARSERETTMPGMATGVELSRLQNATGVTAERLYLQLMIPHHLGGVQMAEFAVAEAKRPEVRALARKILQAQNAEIQVLKSMLQDRGGPVDAP